MRRWKKECGCNGVINMKPDTPVCECGQPLSLQMTADQTSTKREKFTREDPSSFVWDVIGTGCYMKKRNIYI